MTATAMFNEIATTYQQRTGCSDRKALQAAMVAAYMLAVVAKDEVAIKYFEARIQELER